MLWEEAVLIHFTVRKPRPNPTEHCHKECNEWEVIEVRFCYLSPLSGKALLTPDLSGMDNIFGKCGHIMVGITNCRIISNG